MTDVVFVGKLYNTGLEIGGGPIYPGPGGGPVDPGYSPPWARPQPPHIWGGTPGLPGGGNIIGGGPIYPGGPVDPGYSPPWARPPVDPGWGVTPPVDPGYSPPWARPQPPVIAGGPGWLPRPPGVISGGPGSLPPFVMPPIYVPPQSPVQPPEDLTKAYIVAYVPDPTTGQYKRTTFTVDVPEPLPPPTEPEPKPV
jgi:hypothetical protein